MEKIEKSMEPQILKEKDVFDSFENELESEKQCFDDSDSEYETDDCLRSFKEKELVFLEKELKSPDISVSVPTEDNMVDYDIPKRKRSDSMDTRPRTPPSFKKAKVNEEKNDEKV